MSCAFTATTHAPRGTSKREAKPAAAADGSKWPTFDFMEAQWTSREFTDNAPVAAPTYER